MTMTMVSPPSISFAVVLLLLLPLAVTAANDGPSANERMILMYILFAVIQRLVGKEEEIERLPPIERRRRSVDELFCELGPYYLKRAYRMNKDEFWALHRNIYDKMKYNIRAPANKGVPGVDQTNGAVNGLISSSIRLSAAIRFCAGGSPVDIALSHGICVKDVYKSLWRVVDAINSTKSMNIIFPSKEEQKKLAAIAKEKSQASFSKVVGFTDGMLVWIEQPTKKECEKAGFGAAKFYCSRKKKYGLNMTGTCDIHKRFIDIDIKHPGSTSDYLAFAMSPLKERCDDGEIENGYYLFGDCAYMNNNYMVTPYKNSTGFVDKDNFNFFHSQLRINIECAFGILVNRWTVLRRPMSSKIPIHKVSALTIALCKLHNFLIDSRLERTLAGDVAHCLSSGGLVDLVSHSKDFPDASVPVALLHGGQHFDDVPNELRRQRERNARRTLHRDVLCEEVRNAGLRRPTPIRWITY